MAADNPSSQYSKAVGVAAWKTVVGFVWRYFSIAALIKTLLAPFRRDRIKGGTTEYSLLERVVWNIFSRILGLFIRLPLITIGLLSMLSALLLFPIFAVFRIRVDVHKLQHHIPLGRDIAYGFTPFLMKHARDLAQAPETALVGKQQALHQIERILGRERQNNVLLIGEPGVGRTTLLEQLAKRLRWGDTLPQLQYRHIFELQIESMGQEDVRRLMNEAVAAGNIIVVINDLHAYPELPDILLPYIQVADFQIIGVTNFSGYHQNLKFRTDLLQAFEKVEIAEPSNEETEQLLKSIADAHKVSLEGGVTGEIVRLTNQLVHTIPQPEKAIDILEELFVAGTPNITLQAVHTLLSEKTGVPVGELSTRERDILIHLENLLKQYIVGQDPAIESITKAMKRARAGVADESRPVGSFLFAGPTGVGKTYTAQVLSRIYYGSFDAVVRFDMTEYNRSASVGAFTENLIVAMEENPFTLVLFDEIEKAHPEIINLFLQMLEDAHITNQDGRKAYFNNALIVCTSNAGSDLLVEKPDLGQEELVSYMIQERIFSPELLNRFNEIVVFSPFSPEQAQEVASRMLNEFAVSLRKRKNINIEYAEGVIDALARTARTSKFGARAIRRELEDTVESYVAEQIIQGALGAGSTVVVPTTVFLSQDSMGGA